MADPKPTMYIRVRDEKQQFRKDLINYPSEGELKRNPTLEPTRFKIDVFGYDELGRPVCPIFEVEDCAEIQNAIHNDLRRDPRPEEDPKRDPDGMLIPSRLVKVETVDVDRFPKWIGHPTVNMSPDQVYKTVVRINVELLKGNEILGLDPENAPTYQIVDADSKTDLDGHKLFQLWEQGKKNAEERRAKKKESKELVTT